MTNQAPVLLSIARRIVPDLASFNPKEESDFLTEVEQSLAVRAKSMRKQFALFLFVIRWIPLLRWGKTFDRLPAEKQDSILKWLQNSSPSLIRKGFWGLKVLVYLGFYGNPDRWSSLGYAPSFRGNEKL